MQPTAAALARLIEDLAAVDPSGDQGISRNAATHDLLEALGVQIADRPSDDDFITLTVANTGVVLPVALAGRLGIEQLVLDQAR